MDIEKSAQEIFSEHHKSVVLVIRTAKDTRDIGTGFIIGGKETRYLAMTCQHVTKSESNPELTVRLPGDITEYKADILHEDSSCDLAIIEIRGVTKECPALQFHQSDSLACGTVVFKLGYTLPHKLEGSTESPVKTLFPSVTPATISTPVQQNGPCELQDVVCCGSTMHGSSGSPIMLDHKVIGILYAMGMGIQVLYSKPSEMVNNVLKIWLRIPLEEQRTTKEMIESL